MLGKHIRGMPQKLKMFSFVWVYAINILFPYHLPLYIIHYSLLFASHIIHLFNMYYPILFDIRYYALFISIIHLFNIDFHILILFTTTYYLLIYTVIYYLLVHSSLSYNIQLFSPHCHILFTKYVSIILKNFLTLLFSHFGHDYFTCFVYSVKQKLIDPIKVLTGSFCVFLRLLGCTFRG